MATLKDALISMGVSGADLDALEVWAPYRGLGLAERVYRSGLVSDARLVEAFVGLGAVDATSSVLHKTPPPAALGAFTRTLAERHRALPLSVERTRLVVALLDPSDAATIEKLSFTCGLVIEPRSCRPRVLFEGLAAAYDVVVVRPEPAFLASRSLKRMGPGVEDDGFNLPPPSTDAMAHFVAPRVDSNRFAKADVGSPMARMLAEAAELASATQPVHFVDERRSSSTFALLSTAAVSSPALSPAIAQPPPVVAARSTLPAATTTVSTTAPTAVSTSEATNAATNAATSVSVHTPTVSSAAVLTATPTTATSNAASRTSSADLAGVVPPLRCCAVFHVRDNIAVGVDVRTAVVDAATPEVIRDVLVPLTAPGVLSTAVSSCRVAIGNPRDPTTMERTLFRFLRLAAPRSFCAVPVVRDGHVVAVIYADRDDSNIDALDLDELRELASACA